MKRIVLVLLILAIISGSAFALDLLSYPPPLSGGNLMLDAGLGLVWTGWSYGKLWIPPLFLQVEYALPVKVPISVGGGLSFFAWGYDNIDQWGDDYGFKRFVITPQVRANWHWAFPVSWLDFYTGVSLGWNIVSEKVNDPNYKSIYRGTSWFYYNLQAGAHFYFSKKVGAMVETGWPYWLKAGVAFKF